jgi:hypothetical protein
LTVLPRRLVAYERARSSVLQYGDELGVARVDWNRGNVLANLNRFDAAFHTYAGAQVSFRAPGRDVAAWLRPSRRSRRRSC